VEERDTNVHPETIDYLVEVRGRIDMIEATYSNTPDTEYPSGDYGYSCASYAIAKSYRTSGTRIE
jgi:hypothetical protein